MQRGRGLSSMNLLVMLEVPLHTRQISRNPIWVHLNGASVVRASAHNHIFPGTPPSLQYRLNPECLRSTRLFTIISLGSWTFTYKRD